MKRDYKIIKALIPFSWIYGCIQAIRNALYNSGIMKSQKAVIKTIVVGNISVGGTGKTPHTIWLAKEISKTHRIAILSRGYKRKSKGFKWVYPDDTPASSGDEPLEMKRELPDIPVAVDSNRLRGIIRINEELEPKPDFIILDDGFQHRKLNPDFSIILSDFYRPFYTDVLLPAGRLREAKSSAGMADAIIITDTPDEFDKEKIRIKIKNGDEKLLIGSSYSYGDYIPVNEKARQLEPDGAGSVLLVAGIARQERFKEEFGKRGFTEMILFPDHRNYNKKDIEQIIQRFEELEGDEKIVLSTGKDIVKLQLFPEMNEIPLFCIRRETRIEEEDKNHLINSILENG